MRSGGRVVEGARLESEYTSKAYRGFESLPLRHHPLNLNPKLRLSRRVPITVPRKCACLKPNVTARFPRISLAVVYVALGRAPILRTAYAQS
jgi:hypothetical protein